MDKSIGLAKTFWGSHSLDRCKEVKEEPSDRGHSKNKGPEAGAKKNMFCSIMAHNLFNEGLAVFSSSYEGGLWSRTACIPVQATHINYLILLCLSFPTVKWLWYEALLQRLTVKVKWINIHYSLWHIVNTQ